VCTAVRTHAQRIQQTRNSWTLARHLVSGVLDELRREYGLVISHDVYRQIYERIYECLHHC
jgi:hypothetical protein